MAAEGLGLAASVAGLLSLGLQITGGIIKYLDAFESRQEELSYVRQQNDALTSTLLSIETASSSFRCQHPEFTTAVMQNIESCQKELSAVEVLRIELADCDTSTWTMRLENKTKKLTYAFHRSKVQQLAQRLQRANEILQLTLTGLGLEFSRFTTNKLTAIESSSRDHASELLLIRSKIAEVGTPIANIHDRLPVLQGSVDTIAHLVMSHSGVVTHEIQESSQAVRQDFQRSHSSMQLQFRQQQEALGRLETMLEKLQRQNERSQSMETLARRAAGKPAVLKELCDSIHTPKQSHSQGSPLDKPARHSQNRVVAPFHNSLFASTTGRVCICPRPHRLTAKRGIRWGHVYLSGDWETQSHWPSCPLSTTPSKNRVAVSLKYTGVARILKSVIDVSFAMTSGAGGFSISPNFTYYPTVVYHSAPAFRIMDLIGRCFLRCESGNREPFMVACLRKLVRLIDEKKASPTALSYRNESLMHGAAKALKLATLTCHMDSRGMSLFLELIQTLLSYGVPAFTYNTEGVSPLLKVGIYGLNWTQDVIDVLVQANSGSQPAILNGNPPREGVNNSGTDGFWTIDALQVYDRSHGFAEACECGPLSMAVIRNDADEVTRILSRFPGSLAELDIYGQSPFHLAAAKPRILAILVKAADVSLLDQYDGAGVTVLDQAMIYSSTQCINGESYNRCRRCACAQCVEILLEAGCNVRMHKIKKLSFSPGLGVILSRASELARRRYVFHMKELRTPRLLRLSSHKYPPAKRTIDGTDTMCGTSRAEPNVARSPEEPQVRVDNDEAEGWGWIYYELTDHHLGELLYRHGFRPHPTFFIYLRWNEDRGRIAHAYTCWLVEHGGDLFLRSPTGPPVIKNSSNIGLFGAHYAFYMLGYGMAPGHTKWRGVEGWVAFNKLSATVIRRNLTDGCQCHCSTGGCSPFIWMMKGMTSGGWQYKGGRPDPDQTLQSPLFYYSRCGPELTMLTYTAAIRYVTFEFLGLVHTCCNADSLVRDQGGWVDRDDVDIINEEQAPFLELHEKLVAEFEKEALVFIKPVSDGRPLFPQFLVSYWTVRIREELEKLDGHELTDAEKRGAEEIGVQWCDPVEKEENPYGRMTLEYYFYELDLICPEYKEPWPEELRRVTELP